MMRCRAALLALLAAAAVGHPALGVAGDSCPTRVIGIDPSLENTYGDTWNGHGIGQTFYTNDTHIRSLTVWQKASQSEWLGSGLELYIMEISPIGYPDGHNVLFKASLARTGPGDGVHPIPFVFEFHPPLALPSTGEYGFMLYSCRYYWASLIAVQGDTTTIQRIYPDGHAWWDPIRGACRPLGYRLESIPKAHLIFQIVFGQSATPEPIVLESALTDSCWVRLTWSDGGTGASSATVKRHTAGAVWDSVGVAQADGLGHLIFEDTTPDLNTRYDYSLVIDECRFGGECEVVTSDSLAVRFGGAELAERGVRLIWLADNPGTPPVLVYRRGVTIDAGHPVDETWRAIGTGDFDTTGRFVFDDANVMGGARYQYRLAVTRCGRDRILGLTTVDIPNVDIPCVAPAVPDLVSEPTNCGLRLSWASPYVGRQSTALYRRVSADRWTLVGVVTSDTTGQSLYEDFTAGVGEHRFYRLGTRDCAAERFSNEVEVVAHGVVVTNTVAQLNPDHIDLTWTVTGLPGTPATIYRRSADTDWQTLASVEIDAMNVVRYRDPRPSPIPDGLQYRLGIVRCGREGLIGEVSVAVPVVYELAITGLRPNPTERDLVVSFTLPDDQPARFDVLDVAGRRILSRDVGQMGPGSHVVNLTEGRTLRSGMYVIRLSWAGQVRTTRALVVRQKVGRITSGF